MAEIEAVIVYRPSGFEGKGEFRLARTTEADALRAVAQAAVSEARAAAGIYDGLDPALAGASRAEADRLEGVLRQVVPGYQTAPEPGRPRLVPPLDSEGEP